MGSFGERMRREREMRGIKLEEISESTKISRRNLLALEEEHFERLPGGIFNKGFVRAYARFLGLDEDQAVHDFMTASADYDQPAALQPPGSETSVVKPPVIPSDASEKRKQLAWALSAVMVLAAGGMGWYSLNYSKRPSPDQNSAGIAAINGSEQAQGPERSAPSASVAPELARSLVGPGGVPQRQVVVAIRASQETWVSMVVDGKPFMDQVLMPGNESTVRARESVVLRTGNAGGLQVSYNGEPLAPAGKAGQVRTLTFTPRGMQY
jgi:cytoskeleton protein RodZ